MAYMNKELKNRLVSEVKKVTPKNWKLTFAIRHYSTIVCTIRKAPALLEYLDGREDASINHYNLEKHFHGEELETLQAIVNALNLENYNNSDVYTDYHDVGYYVDLKIGEYGKPFIYTGNTENTGNTGK